jgi:hypothetical protein
MPSWNVVNAHRTVAHESERMPGLPVTYAGSSQLRKPASSTGT